MSQLWHVAIIAEICFKSSATDVSARATMKGVAKCDKHSELQSSVSQQTLERMLRFQEIPEGTPASVPTTLLPVPLHTRLCECASGTACFCASKSLAPLSRAINDWCDCASMASSLANLC
jgi:hypothetical protein